MNRLFIRKVGNTFEVYDAKREVTVGVRQVPTPERAVELLARYGVPESEVWGTSETVIVSQEAEWPIHELG